VDGIPGWREGGYGVRMIDREPIRQLWEAVGAKLCGSAIQAETWPAQMGEVTCDARGWTPLPRASANENAFNGCRPA
jgi:hypothetical protein